MENTVATTTTDAKNNVYFTTFKEKWWNLNDDWKLLLQGDQRSLEFIKEKLKQQNLIIGNEGFKLPKNLLILDVGCGGGILTEPLARTGAQVLGIDINKTAIEVAQDHAKLDPCLKNLSYQWESIEKHAVNNVEKYDIVILNWVLHHAQNHAQLLTDCIKTLKPGGIFFASGIGKTFESWIRVILLGEILVKYFPRGGFHWNNFINSSEVEKVLKENRCQLQNIRGMYYDMFSGYWKWTNNINGVYLMYSIKE